MSFVTISAVVSYQSSVASLGFFGSPCMDIRKSYFVPALLKHENCLSSRFMPITLRFTRVLGEPLHRSNLLKLTASCYFLVSFVMTSTCVVAVIMMTIEPSTPLASGYIFNNSATQTLLFYKIAVLIVA